MFGESGLDSRDVRLRAPEMEQSAFEQLEQVVAEYARQHVLNVEQLTLSLSLWAAAHGVARLSVDEAVRLDDAALRHLLDASILALLRGYSIENEST